MSFGQTVVKETYKKERPEDS